MASTMERVCNTLGIDRVNMKSKMILFEEQHGTNANFLVNAILSQSLKNGDGICFVLCHNTFGHYHNVGMRLGYNLSALKEKGQVTVAEPMKIVRDNIVDMQKDSVNKQNLVITELANGEMHTDIAHRLFTYIKEKYDEAMKTNESVVLIVDDISHFLDIGLSTYDVMYFIRYLRSYMTSHPMSQLCVLVHTYEGDLQSLDANIVANGLKHMAHLCVSTERFKSGHSRDASGKLTVSWRINAIKSKFHWTEKRSYLFKLSNWQVEIYPAGAISTVL